MKKWMLNNTFKTICALTALLCATCTEVPENCGNKPLSQCKEESTVTKYKFTVKVDNYSNIDANSIINKVKYVISNGDSGTVGKDTAFDVYMNNVVNLTAVISDSLAGGQKIILKYWKIEPKVQTDSSLISDMIQIQVSGDVTVTAHFVTGFVDPRDSKKYRTVIIQGNKNISDQIWMAENLNYDTADGSSSWCYGNDSSNCDKYGRLYTWSAAEMVCPEGWYLPTRDGWGFLGLSISGTGNLATALKSTAGWNKRSDGTDGNGTDHFGFSALPGGCYLSTNFDGAGDDGVWWMDTDTVINTNIHHFYQHINKENILGVGYGTLNHGYSVRCVKKNN